MRNKWLSVIGLFFAGLFLIGIGIFIAQTANFELNGVDKSIINRVISIETLPFYGSGGVCVIVSVLIDPGLGNVLGPLIPVI